jgi:hypothetical protein
VKLKATALVMPTLTLRLALRVAQEMSFPSSAG